MIVSGRFELLCIGVRNFEIGGTGWRGWGCYRIGVGIAWV